MGYSLSQRLLLVIYTERGTRNSIISARRATRSERKSYQALLKLYIGEGLRQDLSRQFADRVLETTAQVLARHNGNGIARPNTVKVENIHPITNLAIVT